MLIFVWPSIPRNFQTHDDFFHFLSSLFLELFIDSWISSLWVAAESSRFRYDLIEFRMHEKSISINIIRAVQQ